MSMSSAPISYGFPVRALQRWANQHLRWSDDGDGAVEAVFRMEGSTCGNVPMMMLYVVQVGGRSEGWPIRRLHVSPAPREEGHHYQCAYRADADQLALDLAREQPCLGQRLEDALQWAPATSPAGCLCTEQSRAHKWKIVLHTLHFALNRSESPEH
jgi:hypothetical protein